MKFLISIPCQLIVVILIAVTISSSVSKPLKPLTAALSISNAPANVSASPTIDSAPAAPLNLLPVFVALAAAITTFLLWHAYQFYRSESAITQAQHVGANVNTANGSTGLLRYLFSDIKINLTGKRISKRTMASLQQIHNLTSLNVANCGLDRKMLFQFEYCRFLEEIDVSENSFSQDTLLAFRKKISATMHHDS